MAGMFILIEVWAIKSITTNHSLACWQDALESWHSLGFDIFRGQSCLMFVSEKCCIIIVYPSVQ